MPESPRSGAPSPPPSAEPGLAPCTPRCWLDEEPQTKAGSIKASPPASPPGAVGPGLAVGRFTPNRNHGQSRAHRCPALICPQRWHRSNSGKAWKVGQQHGWTDSGWAPPGRTTDQARRGGSRRGKTSFNRSPPKRVKTKALQRNGIR